jgi:hypothetical protein
MTVAQGIVVDGTVLPGTGRVTRDSKAWWAPGNVGCRPRKGHVASLLVGHWTAGNPLTGPGTGAKVVRSMKARLSKDKSRPLDVGVHFVIGWDGLVWQTCDLALATTHVGYRPVILRSVGVETCWPGSMKQAKALGVAGKEVIGRARGARVRCLEPSPELLAAWTWLAETLAGAQHPALAIPRRLAKTTKEAGALEHRDMPATTKVDAAGLLVGALGW